MEPSPPVKSQWPLLVGLGVMVVFIISVFDVIPVIPTIILTIPFGWILYVWRVVPQLNPDPLAVISGILCLAAVTLGTHFFLRWLYAATDPNPEGAVRRRWPWKWTGKLVGLVVLMFVGGIACTGLVQQTIWVIRAPDPWSKDRNEPNPAFSRIGSAIG